MSSVVSPRGLDSAIAGGVIADVGDDGFVAVVPGGSHTPVACLPLEHVSRELLTAGANVLFWRASPDADTGVIMGVVAPPRPIDPANEGLTDRQAARDSDLPETLVLEARSSLVLRVGDGSIEIRADGKILIKGRDLVSHAKRMNRIKGGAVSIN